MECFECGSNDEIHNHHVVPRTLGGTKTVPLCVVCHGKVHNINFLNHKKLTKEGLKKVKMRGVKLGSPKNLTEEAKIKGKEAVKRNRIEDPNWKKAKILIDKFITENGYIHYTKISKLLNEEGYKTRNGCGFSPATVKRLIDN
jgi:hypothetical protein